MSILTQAGVLVLILTIVIILIRSNRRLAEAEKEGEHFVDEWALREEKRLQLAAKKQVQEESSGSSPEKSSESSSEKLSLEESSWEKSFRSPSEESSSEESSWEKSFRSPSEESSSEKSSPKVYESNFGPSLDRRMIPLDFDFILTEIDWSGETVCSIPIRQLPFTIGRAPDNDLVIDDLCIAKHHCRIMARDDIIVMEDAGSRNKVSVGGSPAARTILSDRMVIRIGNRDYLVEMGPIPSGFARQDGNEIEHPTDLVR